MIASFPKDILVLDFEGWAEPTQIGAVLLDKNTLEEKDSFSSYIWADLRTSVSSVSGISQDTLEGAPVQAEVGRALFKKFGTEIFIGCWVANLDMQHFRKIMAAASIDPTCYDYHVLDIWPAAYVHLLKKGYTGSTRSEDVFREFDAKPRGLHDALEDARIAADVLRRVMHT